MPPDHRECAAAGVESREAAHRYRAGYASAALDFLVFAAAVALAVLLWRHNYLLAGCLLAVYLIRSVFMHERGDHAAFVAGAVSCSAVEMIGTAIGAWSYETPTFFRIPAWLPFAWGLTIVLAIRIFIKLSNPASTSGKQVSPRCPGASPDAQK